MKKFLISIPFLLIIIYIFYFYYLNKQEYNDKLYDRVNHIIYGSSAPRGRIYDKNGVVLVDNKQINNLVFHYTKGINTLYVSQQLSNIITLDNPSEKEIINYYVKTNDKYKLLTKKEKEQIKNRLLKEKDIDNILKKRILEHVNYSKEDLNIISIYNKITKGYLYDSKIILENVSDNLVNKIINSNIPGIYIESGFERFYPYNETLRNVFGSVGHITKENKEDYKNYELDDIVGISYLEKQYEEYLKGTKAKYKVNDDYSLTMISEEIKGSDLYLSIDINLQLKLEQIIKEELLLAKNRKNTKYLNDTYSILSNPNTGEIIAMVGERLLSNKEFNDISINNINSSFIVGSTVKGATISVGLKNKLIDPNKKILDSCVKLYSQNEKCSWKSLGYVDAERALEQSSNYYQFLIALKLLGYDYYPNINVKATRKEFEIYRNMLSSYGLGIKTGIDLPGETTGQIGNKVSTDLLLNLAIGQYDAYTPVQLSTYINTISQKGQRRKPSLVSYIKDNDNNIVYQNNYEVIDNTDVSLEDYEIIQNGFIRVMKGGTGWGSFNIEALPAGKTGTSETFIDTDNDGKIDKSTTSLAIVGYFPYNEPKYSLIVISPNVSDNSDDNTFYISAHVSRKFTTYMLDNNY